MRFEQLWRGFPGTLTEFEETFPNDEACVRYLVELRWGGKPRCSRCSCEQMWQLASGRFECRDCGYQMSVTAGTPLHGTRKPLKLWFRAIWEMVARKTGISAKDLQRIMGFGSYETAWTWLHKLRRCQVRGAREPLEGRIQLDDAYLGAPSDRPGRPGTRKAAFFVATEPGGRVRIEHTPDLSKKSVKSFVARNIAPNGEVTTDGYSTYCQETLAPRQHAQHIQKGGNLKVRDVLSSAHRAISLVKRSWIGTYHGAPRRKHLQAYFDEFEFRYNRRKTNGVGRLVARVLEGIVTAERLTYHAIIGVSPCRRFETT